ncbi:hypothetical protein [Rhodococcus erythropolis]|uniref:hypothetical protein n=1 Tax=Rhodococcus erythropolis TaxID=1833 RepID=UPI00211F3AA6|nr:hypothetical protein [Rhodococcus erythropolis]
MRIGHSKVVQPALAAHYRIRRPDRGGGCGTALAWVVVVQVFIEQHRGVGEVSQGKRLPFLHGWVRNTFSICF